MKDNPRAILLKAVSSRVQAQDDKVSLPEQERLMREYCKEHGCQIVAVLTIPGHSRSETDIIDLLIEYEEAGIMAYHDLRRHWKAKDFDMLMAFDSSRIGRSLSLVTYVFENVIKSGAVVQLIEGGRFDESNAEIGIAMCAIQATAGIKRLVRMGKAGMIDRMDRGLSMNSIPPTHLLIHDEITGKPLRLELNEELRPVLDDAVKLLLAGEGWMQFPNKLAALGHLNPRTNKPWVANWAYRIFHNPYTWGASARGYLGKYGIWAFDESEPLPEGVLINRNPTPPVPAFWTGEEAETIKAELRRRHGSIRGHASSKNTYKFTGLLVCGECGYRLGVLKSKIGMTNARKRIYWKCTTVHLGGRAIHRCTQNNGLPDHRVQQQVSDFFERMKALKTYDIADMAQGSSKKNIQAEIAEVEKQITGVQKKINTMIIRQADAPESVQEDYVRQIRAAGEQRDALKTRLQALQTQLGSSPTTTKDRRAAAQEIMNNPTEFWAKSHREINQALHRALGKYRFVAHDGQIVDVR